MSQEAESIFYLDGTNLTLENLDQIFRKRQKLGITPQALDKINISRKKIINMMSQPNRVVYGINTGFGSFADKIISKSQRKLLQINLITSHSVGVGQPLPLNTIKRMMLLRINTLCKGRSGISQSIVQQYIDAFNIQYIPMVPQKGTVGASGDLCPLSHLALGMMGLGKAWDSDSNSFEQASDVMRKKGLKPIQLQQKQGIALINGTQFMSSILTQVISEAYLLLESSIIVLAFAIQIFGVQFELFENYNISLYQKRNPKLAYIMKKVKSYLNQNEASQLNKERIKCFQGINQSQSILQACQSLSGVYQTLQFCKKRLEEQINSATDNPLVYGKQDGFQEDQLISAGNFHGQYVAKCSDLVGAALFSVGKYSQARIQRYINGKISKLPAFLVNIGGINNGFMIAQYTSAALLSQCKVLVKPASVDSIHTSASQQDHVSMGGYAARKARLILDNVGFIVGIELMSALQAIGILKLKPSKKLQQIHDLVRQSIPFLQIDGYFGPQITKAHDIVLSGFQRY